MDALMVDGNAVAGLLREVFAVEMTTAVCTCGNCGASEPIGAVHVYYGAGIVLRCPHCAGALITLVKRGDELTIGFTGVRGLSIAPAS